MSKETMSEKTGGTAEETAAETSGKEFIVDPTYRGYVFLGWAAGLFEAKTRTGTEMRPYYNMYVFSPVSDFVSDEYEASGFKAEKKKCIGSEVWQGLEPGNKVKLFFDDKEKVIMVALNE